jgi:hypothetical protein
MLSKPSNRTSILSALVAALIICSIFATTLFGPLMLLDHTPKIHADTQKTLELSNYTNSLTYSLLSSLFVMAGILFYAQLITLLCAALLGFFLPRYLRGMHSWLFLLIYLFNPFVYTRLAAGQFGVITAYLLFPLFVFYTARAFEQPSLRRFCRGALLFCLVASFQAQFLVLNTIVLAVLTILDLSRRRRFHYGGALILVLSMGLLAYWLQGFFGTSIISFIDDAHTSFFAPKLTEHVPTIAKVIGMWGFWRELVFLTTYKTLPLVVWYAMTAILFSLMLVGYSDVRSDLRKNAFIILWWIGLILAVGVTHPYTKPLFDFLFRQLPYFSGFRDSHKFVVFVAFTYAYLCPIGLQRTILYLKKRYTRYKGVIPHICVLLFVGMMVLYTYPLLDMWGQVHPTKYPASYVQADKFLLSQNVSGHILYLPYYDYMQYNWSKAASPDGRIATPVNKVMKSRILTNPGPWGQNSVLSSSIKSCLEQNSSTCLAQNNVEYVLLDKCFSDFHQNNYHWLEDRVFDSSCLQVYDLHTEGKRLQQEVPDRFIIGICISAFTLALILTMMLGSKSL